MASAAPALRVRPGETCKMRAREENYCSEKLVEVSAAESPWNGGWGYKEYKILN